MGVLRLLLAISVFTAHLGPLFGVRLVDGPTAVQAFFIISGFYISLVLHEKYGTSWGDTRLFYVNRLLRLYPSYWVILVIAISFAVLAAYGFPPLQWFKTQIAFPRFTDVIHGIVGAYVILSNIFLFGIDWAFYITPTEGGFAFIPDFRKADITLNFLNPVPQAWSLGIEVAVYALAPFIFRLRLRYLILLFCVTMVGRLVASMSGLDYDPWTYRFMPFELGLFVVGAICYRVYSRIRDRSFGHLPYVLLAVVFCLLFTFDKFAAGHRLLPFFDDRQLVFLCVLSVALPFIFMATKSNKLDRLVGDLSYPFYLAHLLVMWLVPPAYTKYNILPFSITLGLAIALLVFVDQPMDHVRQHLARRTAKVHS